MAKVIGKKELCSCDKKKFKSEQGVQEHSLIDRYNALENIVKNNIDPKYSQFLAQPVAEENLITWFAKPYNETPQLFSNLQGAELQHYQQIKADTLDHYNSGINRLKQNNKLIEAEFLEKATKFVDNQFLYCYDDNIVLGIWGMQLQEDVRVPLGVAMKNLFVPVAKAKPVFETPQTLPSEEAALVSPPPAAEDPAPELFPVRFNAGDNGVLTGNSVITKQHNEIVTETEVPKIEAKPGYEFIGWNKEPKNYQISEETEFTAQYRPIVPPVLPIVRLPWYRRFWLWLTTLFARKGCLTWLLWLLLLLLLLLLLGWLFRSCNGHTNAHIPYPIGDKPWIGDDPRVRDSGIYHPGDPYQPVPTPPAYRDILPPNQGVMPPFDSTKIIREPGKPAIVDNRLNILMENQDKSILDLAKDFKAKYPDDKYKIVYYDDVVKRIQIEVPAEEREKLKQEIPGKFAPTYELYVFDESMFEGQYTPNDPAFKDPEKSWYLKAVRAPQAWDITKGSAKLTVAIVDNGFSLKHPELSGKVVMPYNVWSHSDKIFPQKIDHGTHVAGTALAMMDNGKGICGIAPQCAFMPIQVGNADDKITTTSMLDGILYALYQGADVINVSLGTQFTGLDAFPESYQKDLQNNHYKEEEHLWGEIMKIAKKHRATIVVAAGNDNVLAGIDPLQRPKDIVIVGAANKKNRSYAKSDFSNYGSYANISAPGVHIYSSIGNDGYTQLDGTSMAAPIVTGTIALMKSLNDSLTNDQIICLLKSTGLPTSGGIGNLVQVDKALEKVKAGHVNDCVYTSTGDVQVLLNWNNYNDLDLLCTDPQGNSVWFKNRTVPSGGQLEVDMNVEDHDSKTPTENIYWPTGSAPSGTYHVYLLYYKRHETDINSSPYKIMVKHGDKTEKFEGVIKKEDGNIHICSFTLGATGSAQGPQTVDSASGNSRNGLIQERTRLKQELQRIEGELQKMGKEKNLRK